MRLNHQSKQGSEGRLPLKVLNSKQETDKKQTGSKQEVLLNKMPKKKHFKNPSSIPEIGHFCQQSHIENDCRKGVCLPISRNQLSSLFSCVGSKESDHIFCCLSHRHDSNLSRSVSNSSQTESTSRTTWLSISCLLFPQNSC